jgi:hypothetical protein
MGHRTPPLQLDQHIASRNYSVGRTKITTGVEGEAFDVSYENPLFVSAEPIQLSIGRGAIPPGSSANIFAQNPAIGTTEEDLWAFGGSFTWLAAASLVRFVSTSINDDSTGSGARTGTLTGLDASYVLQTESITLNGTGNADSTKSYLRVLRFEIDSVGAGLESAGDITITAVTGGTELGFIVAGNAETRISMYTVPNKKAAYMYRVYFNSFANTTKIATINIQCRFFHETLTKPWVTLRELNLSNEHVIIEVPYFRFPAKTDFIMRGISDQTSTIIAGGYDFLLLDED